MSSNIKLNKICEFCRKEFEARKTTTKTCSDRCAKLLYKQKQKKVKVELAESETAILKAKPIEALKAKEFLTVKDVSKLLNCSVRTVYSLIRKGNIKAVNLAQRKTLIMRSEIDKIFTAEKNH